MSTAKASAAEQRRAGVALARELAARGAELARESGRFEVLEIDTRHARALLAFARSERSAIASGMTKRAERIGEVFADYVEDGAIFAPRGAELGEELGAVGVRYAGLTTRADWGLTAELPSR
jgi:hypothetical protein